MFKNFSARKLYNVCVHKGHHTAHLAYLAAATLEGRSFYSYAAGALLIFTVATLCIGGGDDAKN
jgi:hypothetical protein